jgi:hypothetical protein
MYGKKLISSILLLLFLFMIINYNTTVVLALTEIPKTNIDNQIQPYFVKEFENHKLIKVLVDDAIQSLYNSDTKGALVHLNLVKEQLTAVHSKNSTIYELANVLVDDAIQFMQKHDTKGALVHLNLVKEQLVMPDDNITYSNQTGGSQTITLGNMFTCNVLSSNTTSKIIGNLITNFENVTLRGQFEVIPYSQDEYESIAQVYKNNGIEVNTHISYGKFAIKIPQERINEVLCSLQNDAKIKSVRPLNFSVF